MGSMSDIRKDIMARLGAIDSIGDRPGAKDTMAATPHKITLKDKSGVTQTWMVSDKILRDMNATKRYSEATGAKPDYSSVLRLGVRMGEVVLASRPGAKAKMQKEYVLWGIPKGKTSALDEQVLSTQAKTPAQMDAIKKRAAADGWHSFRVQILDLSKPYKGFGFARPGAKAKMAVEAGWRVSPDAKSSGLTVTELLPKLAKGHTFYANLKSGGTVSGTLKAFSTSGVKIDKYGDVTDLRWSDIASIGAGNIGTGPYPIRASRPGAKAKMGKHIRTVAEDKEASRRGLRVMIDQLESEWQSLNNQPSKAGRIPRMETIKKQIAGLEDRLKSLSSRPGAKATMARWEATQTKKHGKPITEHTAKIDGVSYMIEKPDAMGTMATLYMWNDNRGMERIATGDVATLKARAEGMRKKEARGVAAIERLANYSRPGAKAKMAESLQAMWDGKQWKVTTPSGAAWYSEDGKRWTKKHGEPVTPAEVRQYAIKLGTGFSRPGAKVANAVREGEKVSASDDAVSRKIRKLMDEGKPQKQAVAIALDLERRGEL